MRSLPCRLFVAVLSVRVSLAAMAHAGSPLIRRALRQSLLSAYTLFARLRRLGTEP